MTSEQQVILDRIAAVTELLGTVASAGEDYNTYVLMSQERLEKLPALDRVEEWLNAQDGLFAKEEYGETLVEVSTLLTAHQEHYVVEVLTKKQVKPKLVPLVYDVLWCVC